MERESTRAAVEAQSFDPRIHLATAAVERWCFLGSALRQLFLHVVQGESVLSRTYPFANPTLNHPARATAPFFPFDATRLPLAMAIEATLASALLVVLRDIQDVLGAAIVREIMDAFARNRPRQICHGPKHVFVDFERMSRSILI